MMCGCLDRTDQVALHGKRKHEHHAGQDPADQPHASKLAAAPVERTVASTLTLFGGVIHRRGWLKLEAISTTTPISRTLTDGSLATTQRLLRRRIRY